VLTSGGISAGAYEVVKEALAGRGVEFVKVAMQPGGPQGVGRVGGVGVVALPGNPVSSQVSFEVFVRPPLRAALGYQHPERPRVTAALAAPLTSTPGRRQFRRGRRRRRRGYRPGGRRATVAPARSAGAGRLLLRRARGDHRTGRRLTRRGVAPRGLM
jgi:molybdopterin biosynthesis enzyme